MMCNKDFFRVTAVPCRNLMMSGIFLFLMSFCLWGTPTEGKAVSVPRIETPPRIDGILDEALWENQALKIEDFVQFAPKEGDEPTEITTAYMAFDRKNLYFAFRCRDKQPDKIRATITKRDNIMEDDWVVVFLDAFNEKRRAFSFLLNPIGIQADMIRMEEGGSDNMDDSWDTVFYSEGTMDSQGYYVEIAIPFKSLRFPDDVDKTWNVMLGRVIARSGEILLWPGATQKISGLISQGNEIEIRGEVEKGRNVELMPVLTSLKVKGAKIDPEPGLNFKWGLNSDLTMDLTLNPDFSQIEADAPQIEVNQRFALYYAEKRPFFLEGMEIFRFPELEMVYTRRIIDPSAGAKLTGKTGRFTYGLLSAYDTSPTENLWEVHNGGGTRGDNALFNIIRVKADVFKESYVGFCLADKEIDGTFNRVAGIDGQFKFKRNFFLSFQAIGSKTRYEERETKLVPAFYLDFSSYHKYWGAGVDWRSLHPDFEASSGYINRVDYRSLSGYAFFQVYPEKRYLHQVRLTLRTGRRFDYFEDILIDTWAEADLQLRLNEFSQVFIKYIHDMERYAGFDFRKNSINANANINLVRWLPFGFSLDIGDGIFYDPEAPYLGWSHIYSLYFRLKPGRRLQIGFDLQKQTFWKERGGELAFDYNVIRQRTTYQLSKTLSVRAILDYNHFEKKIYGSFLTSWVLQPGTVFFFGVDNHLLRDEFGKYMRNDYSVFIKFSYWWRM